MKRINEKKKLNFKDSFSSFKFINCLNNYIYFVCLVKFCGEDLLLGL